MASTQTPLLFVTGASSGIGQALAARYHRAGWRLALVARREAELRAWAAAQGMDAAGVYSADVTDFGSIGGAARDCLARQGLPDVVVANAGISLGVDTADAADLEVMRLTYATNVLGMAATFQPFLRPMRVRRAGTLVGIASVAGVRGIPGHGAYSSSKAAVIAYCESLRGELRSSGVRVVTIAPGYIDTPLTQGNRYSMPFLMSAEAFADRAFASISAGDRFRFIPWQMAIVARLLKWMPNALYDRALAGRPRKKRQSEA